MKARNELVFALDQFFNLHTLSKNPKQILINYVTQSGFTVFV